MRKEAALRARGAPCPVYRHLGLYGFRTETLRRFCALPPGIYEELEGLEQLRLLENGIDIHTVPVSMDKAVLHSGIDSPDDLARAEEALNA
jgi:3-deoxy-manno-octulosonate cytidylyltransferase (CMP-KDO synthetase)